MKISVFSIVKHDSFASFYKDITKQCRTFGASLEICDIFNSQIAQAQKTSAHQAQKSYTQALIPHLGQNNYALHPQGKQLDSFQFAKLLEGRKQISFFIGGAYGFEQDFLKHTQNFSLSLLTLSHQVAKLLLCEQIYRGLSINAHHPYHK